MQNSLTYFIDGILRGDRRVLARGITLVESRRTDHRQLAGQLVDALLPRTGRAIRLGITGVPGAGKSTLVESLGLLLIRQGLKVAVLAVDPSSVRSGGSILADKTRMPGLVREDHAFIRPSPSSGTLGGVARMTRETMLLCEAAGFDVVIVETVGVGQNETTVASMVDFFLALMITGAGDELQGMKKGLLELVHAVAINKADGENLARARNACAELAGVLQLVHPESADWTPPVVTCSALTGDGLEALWAIVLDHRRRLEKTGALQARRREQALAWMWALIHDELADRFQSHPAVRQQLPQITARVRSGDISAGRAAQKLLLLLDITGDNCKTG